MASLPREPYIPEMERPSADEMDEQRKEQIAYEYLLRLEEARGWISECLSAELPPAVELEESLRNGVLFGRIANYFAKDVISERKVFDINEERYKSRGLHFRHTDNIMQWIRAMRYVGLPEVFIPDTTDIYDKKNMPKAIFCVHALSLYLYRRGLAPPMRDVSGNVAFTKEEISMVAEALAQQGIRLPPFSKIGGMLAEELSKDEAELHAAVVAINEAIDSGDPKKTCEQLRSPSAQLHLIVEDNCDQYQDKLFSAKSTKVDEGGKGSGDLYDKFLTHNEIQEIVNNVNEMIALNRLNKALMEGTPQTTLEALQDPLLKFPRVWPAADSLYYQELRSSRQQKGVNLDYQDVYSAIKVLNSVVEVNQSLDSEEVESLWNALNNKQLEFDNLERETCPRYLYRMRSAREEKVEGSCRFLNRSELASCIQDANQPLGDEERRAETLAKLQDAIKRQDLQLLLQLLKEPCGHLSNVKPENIEAYGKLLNDALVERDPNGNAFLSFEEIQDFITRANTEILEGITVCAAVSDVNGALNKDASHEILYEVLERNSGTLEIEPSRNVSKEYKEQLKNSQDQRKEVSENKESGVWIHFVTPVGLDLYIKNDASGEIRFKHPQEPLCTWYLERERITDDVQKVNDTDKLDRSATVIQTKYRGWSQKKKYLDKKDHYENRSKDIVKTQAQVRMWLCRREYLRRLEYLRQQQDPVTKIQRFFRRKQSQKDYKALTQSDAPSLSVVRKFATLILQTELDYEEAIEIQRLKSQVGQEIRSIKKLEEDLNVMDLKIGLLVKNRLGVEEVLLHGQRLSSHQLLPVASEQQNGTGPRSLNKSNREHLEYYQQLLYLIQTEPQYLTRLLFIMPPRKVTRLIDNVIFPLFNFATQRREEYFLLRLLKVAMVEEIQAKVSDISDVLNEPMLVTKILVNFTRHLHGDALLKDMLEPVIKKLISEKKEELNTVPLEIYKYCVGEPPKNMSHEEAALHPQVAPVFEASLSYISQWAGAFIDAITNNLDHIPYGLRYIAKVMRLALKEKFPTASEKEIVKAVGHLVYCQYLNPSIANPDEFGVLNPEVEKTISPDDKKKLESVAQLLRQAAINRGFGGENAYLSPLNRCIMDFHDVFNGYFARVTAVPEPESVFGMDKYSEFTMTVKPVVYMTLGDVAFLHQVLLEYESTVAPEDGDPVKILLHKMGSKPPKPEDLPGILTDENEVHRADIASTDVHIELDPQFRASLEEGQDATDRNLFLQTKKLVLDVILCQQGDTLPEVLSTVATAEQEESHRKLEADAMTRRKAQNINCSQDGLEGVSLEEKKVKIRENLTKLESRNLVSSSDDYQALINAIATDIKTENKNRDRRKNELSRLKDILKRMDEKSSYQNEQIEAYNQYIQGCLENLAPKSKRRSIQLDSKTSKRFSDSGDAMKSVKYSGEKLAKKGVLLGIEGTPENQLKNVSIEIESGSPGVFDVHLKEPDADVARTEIVLHELLKLQYEGADRFTLLGKVYFSLDELIFFLNKKFYCS